MSKTPVKDDIKILGLTILLEGGREGGREGGDFLHICRIYIINERLEYKANDHLNQ